MTYQNELKPFLEKEYRDAYLEGHVKGGIALQIHAIREKLGISQKEFGELIGKPQSVVSRLEDTEYGAVSVQTLISIAQALNIGLHIQFCDYGAILAHDYNQKALEVNDVYQSYENIAPKQVVVMATTAQLMPQSGSRVGPLMPMNKGYISWQMITGPNPRRSLRFPGSGTPYTEKSIPTRRPMASAHST